MSKTNGHALVKVTVPIPLDKTDPRQKLVAALAAMGVGTKGIMKFVPMTACQIQYRLSSWGIKRSAWRNGEGQIVRQVVRRTMGFVEGVNDRRIARIKN